MGLWELGDGSALGAVLCIPRASWDSHENQLRIGSGWAFGVDPRAWDIHFGSIREDAGGGREF